MINAIESTDVVVRDGSTVCVRRTTGEDLDALSQFFHSLSSESLYYRFLGIPSLTEARIRALAATDDDAVGISLVVESAGRIEDPRTSVILLYLESFGNPKKFSEIARCVGRTKPIVAVKAGRSAAGSRAAASHTGALATSDDPLASILGVRALSVEQWFVVLLCAAIPAAGGQIYKRIRASA